MPAQPVNDFISRWSNATPSKRVKAVSVALSSAKEAVTAETMAKRFARAKPADVAEILETLCTMGHAHRGKAKGTFLP